MQDLFSKKLIGAGRQRGGLYYLQKGNHQHATYAATSSMELWHQRLGHPSQDRFLNIPSLSHLQFKSDCLICPRVKGSRHPFGPSNKRSTFVFYLVHIDVWGLYHTRSSSGVHYFVTIVDDFSRSV